MSNNNPGGDDRSHHPKSDEHNSRPMPDPAEQQPEDGSNRRHGSDRGPGTGHKGRSSNPGNFANDPDRARKAGQKGGKA
jgi:general stress protein YciG